MFILKNTRKTGDECQYECCCDEKEIHKDIRDYFT